MMDLDYILDIFPLLSARSLLLLSLALLLAARLARRSPPLARSIPGPFPWPVIGNAAQLGSTPHIYFSRMAQRYGDVFQVWLGSRRVVVLNGEAIRGALVHKAVDFAGRPDFASFRFVSGGRSMAFGDYGESWKAHRKLAQSTTRAFSVGDMNTRRAFESHVRNEVQELIGLFLRETQRLGQFRPHYYLVVSTANIMSAVCFGKRYAYDDAEFRQVVGRNDKFSKTVGAGSMVDVMPWLQDFPNPIKTLFLQFKELNLEFFDFIQAKVTEHRKTMEDSFVRDMTDAFIIALERGSASRTLSQDYVSSTIGDIFGASQDTLSTAVQWIVLMLVRYPNIQKRLQEEVDKKVDRNCLPTIEDQKHVPYVMAFIYEVMRFTSFIPVTIPHATTTDTSINGYPIPKGTVIFINQWSLNHDPSNWDEPEVFNPQRFLDENGELNKDLTSNVLVFSLGKRRCIGEELSKMQLFLFTTLLVHQCNFTAEKTPPLDGQYGLTLKPNPYNISVTLRDGVELQCVQNNNDKTAHDDLK
ncbi:cytochrome P450 1B1 [Astyanax mexicanus]|uniref:cytochrome P450 1B1 n=1 Tax=Astyanax mexicanus TaxID=7994 RepID=UPI0020CABEFB|nr:cytochrome P450 1B1 [Astyanax mexicanus]